MSVVTHVFRVDSDHNCMDPDPNGITVAFQIQHGHLLLDVIVRVWLLAVGPMHIFSCMQLQVLQ